MYKPLFNTLVVEIDDKAAKWGGGNDDSMLGASYRQGKIVDVGPTIATKEYPSILEVLEEAPELIPKIGTEIMWNEGTEAGTTWDEDGKLYGFIYWWDVRGVKK